MNLQEQAPEQQSHTGQPVRYSREELSASAVPDAEYEQPKTSAAGLIDEVDRDTPTFGGDRSQMSLPGLAQEGILDMDAGGAEGHTAVNKVQKTVEIPILLYHHIAQEANGSATISERTFLSHLEAIDAASYNTISFEELIAYVEEGAHLPENPLIITFDDGYLSNYEIAYQALREYGMKATIFSIGVSLGKDSYKDTGIAITPHFGVAEIQEMLASGLISIQCHTYDMHQTADLDDSYTFRTGVLPRNGESDADYKYNFYKDVQLFRQLLEPVSGQRTTVFAYPFGAYNEDTEAWLDDMGFKATLTITSNSNIVERGDSDSLKLMNRYEITEAYSATDLLNILP